MNFKRAILSGSLVWMMTFFLFAVLGSIPEISESNVATSVIVGICIIPFSLFGAIIYFKKAPVTNRWIAAITMVATAVSLDLIITVPFYEIPYNDGSYGKFLSDPLLWILATENVLVIYGYSLFKARRRQLSV